MSEYDHSVYFNYSANGVVGECAPGGVRQTLGIPTKSALLGILEGAVGITRDREKMHGAFAANYEL